MNAASSAMHLALEPQTIPAEYCSPSFTMAGWIVPGPEEKLEGGRVS